MDIITKALQEGRRTLSEHEAKTVLAEYGIPVTRERLTFQEAEFLAALEEIGFPLVLKACAPDLSHKTERGLVHVDLRSTEEARAARDQILEALENSAPGILVQEYVRGARELVAGLNRDPQFGPCVMFGLGGIFTEVLEDVVFRVAPLTAEDALEMMEEIRAGKILEPVRGLPAADTNALAEILVQLGRLGLEKEEIREVDINPLILCGARPVAVDALIVLEG